MDKTVLQQCVAHEACHHIIGDSLKRGYREVNMSIPKTSCGGPAANIDYFCIFWNGKFRRRANRRNTVLGNDNRTII